MFALPSRYIYEGLILIALSIGAIAMLSSIFAQKEARFLADAASQLARAREELRTLAALTNSNRADEEVASLLSDCSARGEYEEKMSRLGHSGPSELLSTRTLFLMCGDIDAERKRLMTLKLQHAFSRLASLEQLLEAYGARDTYPELVAVWGDIVRLERERSQLFSEQVRLQGSIIEQLILGRSLVENQRRAQEIGQLLDVAFRQIEARKKEEEAIRSVRVPET